MYNKKTILGMYNSINEEKINQQEFLLILPKLYLIINKAKLDEVEILNTIDSLEKIKECGKLDKITPELVDLIIKVTKTNFLSLEDSLYFSDSIKHILLPYNLNVCDNEYNLMKFLSLFEMIIELASIRLNKKELLLLDKYNHELKEVIVKYKEAWSLYKRCVRNDILLRSMLSHFAVMLYFNSEEFEYNYDLLPIINENIIENYQAFIDYCCSYEIHKKYYRQDQDIAVDLDIEYIVSYDMLKYLYNYLKSDEKIKRK